jgi:hypothetical protein
LGLIFISKNESGELAWKLILENHKRVTRRLKPVEVGKVIAVCPGRGVNQVCKVKVISCIKHIDWVQSHNSSLGNSLFTNEDCNEEAKKEGFNSWEGLMSWFNKNKINIFNTYRIEFELIEKGIN